MAVHGTREVGEPVGCHLGYPEFPRFPAHRPENESGGVLHADRKPFHEFVGDLDPAEGFLGDELSEDAPR